MFKSADLLTTAETGKVLDIKPREVSRLVQRGDLTPALKSPGLRGPMFFDPAEVEQVRVLRELEAAGKPKTSHRKR